jgi:hypothetical protein
MEQREFVKGGEKLAEGRIVGDMEDEVVKKV